MLRSLNWTTATANGASLVLSYDKTLDEDSLPAGSDFAVSVTDSVTGVEAAATVAQVDVAAATVTLTLATPVRFGDTVTVTYTPGDDPIQVGAGTLAAALASHTVTNNTAKATDATLGSLELSAGDDALSLSPAFEAAKTGYSAQVANEVTQVTVTAAVADSRASLTLPTDDDTVTDGVQIDLAAALAEASDTTITVTVTAEDSTTTATYTVTVTRAADTTAPSLSFRDRRRHRSGVDLQRNPRQRLRTRGRRVRGVSHRLGHLHRVDAGSVKREHRRRRRGAGPGRGGAQRRHRDL